jgi:putative transcriptional regulator
MKPKDTCWVDHEPGEPFPETDTDWNAVDALTDEEVHAAAQADPDAQPIPDGSDEELARQGMHRLVNVKKLRERLGLTQEEFAATYRIPVGTLRDWEQRRKNSDAPARAYLMVIAKNPQAVAEWLRPAA